MSTKNKLHILGYGEWLGYAYTAAQELNRWESVDVTVLKQINDYSYDLQDFQVQDTNSEYFLALGGDAFGTVREKHLSDLVSRGFQFASLMPESLGKKINSLISSGVIISNNQLSIGFNAFIGPNSIVGNNLNLGRSSTIGANSYLLQNITVGKNVSLSNNITINPNLSVGTYVSVEKKVVISENLKSGYLNSELFDRVINIRDAR
jgi:acetyltransferase-like isoleucine patch superfamily enzyme